MDKEEAPVKPLLLLLALLLAALFFGRTQKRNPAYSRAPLSRQDLAGLWRQSTDSPLVGYLYFAPDGSVYFMASRIPASANMFTSKFKVAASYSSCGFSRWKLQAEKNSGGGLLLAVSGEAIGGSYHKVG